MAQTPNNGPGARITKAHDQPSHASATGTRWMVTSASRNPQLVCTVSMVPISSGSASSATLAENCAESATTATPHTRHSATTSHGGPPNRKPATMAQAPLIAIAPMVRVVRPTRPAR